MPNEITFPLINISGRKFLIISNITLFFLPPWQLNNQYSTLCQCCMNQNNYEWIATELSNVLQVFEANKDCNILWLITHWKDHYLFRSCMYITYQLVNKQLWLFLRNVKLNLDFKVQNLIKGMHKMFNFQK